MSGGAEGSLSAVTDLDIINTALSRMGESPITDFGQTTGVGIIMQSSYNFSRNDLLRRQPWNFARRWVSLNLLTTVPLNLDIIPEGSGPGVVQFTAAFQLPDNCLRVFRFSPKDAHWRIIGKQLYTDAAPATTSPPLFGLEMPNSDGSDNVPTSSITGAPYTVGIEYVRCITNPQEWDSCFVDAFIWKLIKEMSMGVTGKIEVYKVAKVEYDDSMKGAAMINGIENWPDPFWNTDLNDVRYGYTGVTIEGY